MSARVFNRFAMSEARVPRGSPPGPEVERARRVLFPPHNCAQDRQFVADELANINMQKSEQFNFDFERGLPLETAGGRFQWQKVNSTEPVPEAYALERFPFLSSHAASSDASDRETAETSHETTFANSRQSSITDFMQKRKSAPSAACSKSSSISSALTSTSEPATKKKKTSSSS